MFALALTLCLSTTPASVPSARLMSDEAPDIQRMSLAELQFERTRLLELMPTKFLPVLVMVGTPLVAFFLASVLPSFIPGLAVSGVQIALIVGAAVIGVAGFIVGLIWTIATAQRQADIRRDIADVDALIAGRAPRPIAPTPVEQPYEPVPGVLAPTVRPTLLLARF